MRCYPAEVRGEPPLVSFGAYAMFTGIIEAMGTVRSLRPTSGGRVLVLELGAPATDLAPGESLAVSGVCLTLGRITGAIGEFDVSAETLKASTLASLQPGARVNLERALTADGRLGGHIVQGHVDGIGHVTRIDKSGDFWEMTFEAEPGMLADIVPKGSVAVDGISLTVARMDEHGFTVALIPTTLRETTLSQAMVGQAVNIETDILVRTIRAQLERMLGSTGGLTIEKLREAGF